MWAYLLATLGISVGINLAMFAVAFRRKTDKLTDISYALSFAALAIVGLWWGGATPFSVVLCAMILVWATRLGGFLLFRIWHIGRDARFDAIRGNFLKFGKFWLGQGVTVWVLLVPSLLAFREGATSISLLAVLGAGIWAIGLSLEAAADWQKFRFSQNPANKNRWIASGVWQYSRHPNYFGEILVWTGVYFYAASVLPPLASLVGLVSPALIIVLLLFVSGIPILEKSADKRWGSEAAYREYKRRTSILIPWPPRTGR